MMEANSTHGRLRKVCPQCSGNVHIKRAVCEQSEEECSYSKKHGQFPHMPIAIHTQRCVNTL